MEVEFNDDECDESDWKCGEWKDGDSERDDMPEPLLGVRGERKVPSSTVDTTKMMARATGVIGASACINDVETCVASTQKKFDPVPLTSRPLTVMIKKNAQIMARGMSYVSRALETFGYKFWAGRPSKL